MSRPVEAPTKIASEVSRRSSAYTRTPNLWCAAAMHEFGRRDREGAPGESIRPFDLRKQGDRRNVVGRGTSRLGVLFAATMAWFGRHRPAASGTDPACPVRSAQPGAGPGRARPGPDLLPAGSLERSGRTTFHHGRTPRRRWCAGRLPCVRRP